MFGWYATLASFLFPIYFLVDLNYFIRVFCTVIYSRFRKKIHFLDPSTIYGIVLTSDIDFLFTHMNNARYLRELDFARLDHGTRSGFWQEGMRRGGAVLLTSSFIRYRLALPVFWRYKITTNVVWWDEKNVFLSHKVITLSDNIVRAVIYARATCVKMNVIDAAEAVFPGLERPELDSIAPDYRKWMETLELSSKLSKASNGIKAKTEESDEDKNSMESRNHQNSLKSDDGEIINTEILNGNVNGSVKSNQYILPEKVGLMHQD